MKCSKCGFEFDDSFDFCPKCGSPVECVSNEVKVGDNADELDKADTADKADKPIEMHWGDTEEPSNVKVTTNNSVSKPFQNKKLLIIVGVVIVLLLLIIIGTNNSKSTDSTTDDYAATESYQSDDYDYDEDYDDYDTDTEMDLIQGSWDLIGVINDGESTYVGDTSYSGSLDIYDDTFEVEINTTSTSSYSGYITFDYSKDGFYLYSLRGTTGTESVRMIYSEEDNYIAVSTQSEFDKDNCMMFSKL